MALTKAAAWALAGCDGASSSSSECTVATAWRRASLPFSRVKARRRRRTRRNSSKFSMSARTSSWACNRATEHTAAVWSEGVCRAMAPVTRETNMTFGSESTESTFIACVKSSEMSLAEGKGVSTLSCWCMRRRKLLRKAAEFWKSRDARGARRRWSKAASAASSGEME